MSIYHKSANSCLKHWNYLSYRGQSFQCQINKFHGKITKLNLKHFLTSTTLKSPTDFNSKKISFNNLVSLIGAKNIALVLGVNFVWISRWMYLHHILFRDWNNVIFLKLKYTQVTMLKQNQKLEPSLFKRWPVIKKLMPAEGVFWRPVLHVLKYWSSQTYHQNQIYKHKA